MSDERWLVDVRFVSLCGLKSDISRGPRSARNGREHMQQTMCANARLLDHRVAEREQRRRHVAGERLGGCEIDDNAKFGRLRDRRGRPFLAFEDAPGICLDEPLY